MNKFKNLVFDFNGTIIDDVQVCLDILNKMLANSNHPQISLDQYLHTFTFPIYDYYIKAGFDIKPNGKDNFEELSKYFDKSYRAIFNKLKPFPDIVPFLKNNYQKYNLYILSATKQNDLENELKQLNIYNYFRAVIGINNIFAYSKVNEAIEYFTKNNIKSAETAFIGDTTHDNEVAKKLNATSILIARGHQAKDVLEKTNANYVISNIKELERIL